MKSLYGYFLGFICIIGFLSCTESIKMQYNESKSIPFSTDFDKPSSIIGGTFTKSGLLSLLNVPSDAKVNKFTINGFTITVSPSTGTEADFVEYAAAFKGNNDDHASILATNNTHFLSTGEQFNITSELNSDSLSYLKCLLGNMIQESYDESCGNSDIVKFSIIFNARDINGNPKNFKGRMTGTFNFQIAYTVCEEVPEKLFSEFDKCDK
jgi:hypothetical protein